MNQGWECKKCGAVMAPVQLSCINCTGKSDVKTIFPEAFPLSHKCLMCGGNDLCIGANGFIRCKQCNPSEAEMLMKK